MPQLVILGSAAAVPEVGRDHTHMVLIGEQRQLLVDCGVNPYPQLKKLGFGVDCPSDLVMTHFHPDHTAGLSTFLLSTWLSGRTRELNIFGLQYTIQHAKQMMDLYDWRDWPGFYPLNYIEVPEVSNSILVKCDEFLVTSYPVQHVVPNIGLRMQGLESGRIAVYTSDTEPCESILGLTKGADYLIHEATGAGPFHSSAAQAGETARLANAKSLYLVHYHTHKVDPQELVEQARSNYDGPVTLVGSNLELDI